MQANNFHSEAHDNHQNESMEDKESGRRLGYGRPPVIHAGPCSCSNFFEEK
jgi:hypothetical protein